MASESAGREEGTEAPRGTDSGLADRDQDRAGNEGGDRGSEEGAGGSQAINIDTGREAQRAVILGRTGSGKSVAAKNFIAAADRVVVWDIRRQHSNSGHIINSLPALKEGISWAKFRLIYQPTTLTEEEFGAVCQTVYQEGNMLYVVEEADTFATPAYINDDFNKCIAWGRMRGLGVISISRRPANLHKNCLSEINHLLLFHIHLPNDTDYLKKFVPPVAVDEAMTLDLYEFIYWKGGTTWYRHSPLPYLA